jgi:hypothetical protein
VIRVPPFGFRSRIRRRRAGQGAAQIGLMGESPELHASSLHFFAFQIEVTARQLRTALDMPRISEFSLTLSNVCTVFPPSRIRPPNCDQHRDADMIT